MVEEGNRGSSGSGNDRHAGDVGKFLRGRFLVTGTELDGTRFQTGTDVENNFGRMLVPDNNYTFVGWNYGESAALELDGTPRLVCVFYTPERTCSAPGDADKLVLNMSGISSSDGDRGGQAVLRFFPRRRRESSSDYRATA